MDEKELYFRWLYARVCGESYDVDKPDSISFKKLLRILYERPYVPTKIHRDLNRMKDGAALRYTFKREVCNCELALEHECSMLEMMLSLAMRCELIMDDTRYGDRTMSWFWSMVASLGLNGDTDRSIDEKDVNDKIDLFLNHEYAPDGRGGLFFIYRCNTDLRDLELWDQAMLFLNKLLGY